MQSFRAVLIVSTVLAVVCGSPVHAQRSDRRADEAAIRALVESGEMSPLDDGIFWSGALPEPVLGRQDTARVKPLPQARMEQRRNQKLTPEIVRLDVAEAGDMAYEFSNFTLSFDLADTNEHVSFPGSLLRVWKKVDGQWRVAAVFMRPHERP